MSEPGFDVNAWRNELEQERREKDRFLAEHPHSPVPPERRDAVEGLDYYDPDPSCRVRATVETHDDPELLEMETTTGEIREYARVVTLQFEVAGTETSLAGYDRVDGDEPGLFVPFRDATSGEETYGAGCYLELDATAPYTDGQTVVVDFNGAYSPFCAFSDQYSCPLPPTENWLDVQVRAGERHDPEAAYAAEH
jgi:Uncharacterized conserved protein